MNYDRIQQQAGHLPAFQIADTINSTLKESANLVVTAPPGAGKSTVLPLTLLEATPTGQDSDAGTTPPCCPSDS